MDNRFQYQLHSNKLQNLPADIIKTGSWAISQIYRNGGNLYEFYMPKWLGVDPQTGAPLWEQIIKDDNGNVVSTEATSDYASQLISRLVLPYQNTRRPYQYMAL
jgi:hypothetical protein